MLHSTHVMTSYAYIYAKLVLAVLPRVFPATTRRRSMKTVHDFPVHLVRSSLLPARYIEFDRHVVRLRSANPRDRPWNENDVYGTIDTIISIVNRVLSTPSGWFRSLGRSHSLTLHIAHRMCTRALSCTGYTLVFHTWINWFFFFSMYKSYKMDYFYNEKKH